MEKLLHFIGTIFAMLTVVIFVGCNVVNHSEGLGESGTVYNLQVKSRQELLMGNGRMAMIDSFLIIVSSGPDDICRIYDIYDNNKEICAYGKTGNGPGEFIQPLLTYAWNNEFGLNEMNKQELAILAIDKPNTGEAIVVHEEKRLKASYQKKKGEWTPTGYFITKLDSSHYVSLVGVEDGRFFSLSNITLQHIDYFGESPIKEDLPPIAARNRLSGKIATYNGRMVFGTVKLPYLVSYKICDEKMEKMWSLYYAETGYGVKNGDLLFDKDRARGPLLDLKMDSKYIYALYLDQLLSDYDHYNVEKSTSNKILVFDYDGNNVACFNLGCRIQEMAILPQGQKMYGLTQYPDFSLVEFVLPDELYQSE